MYFYHTFLDVPIILWWTPFGNDEKLRDCGNYQCYFISNRSFQYHKQIKVMYIIHICIYIFMTCIEDKFSDILKI